MDEINNKTTHYQIVWTPCRGCGMTIQRVGVWEDEYLIGYLGNNCQYCGLSEKADENNIDYIQTSLPINTKRKTGVWRDDFKEK